MNSERKIHLFVLIDALGWRFLEGRPFLNDILPVRMPLRTVLGFSSGAIPTILTGLVPSQTGHWNLFYYDPANSPFRWLRFLRYVPASIADNRVTRKLMKELGRRFLGMGPTFECHVSPKLLPWFNYVERRCIYETHGVSGGPSIFDRLENSCVPYRVYTYHHWTDAEILSRARQDVNSTDARFFFVYLSEMDHLLHEHSRDDRELDRKLDWYAAGLRALFEDARRIDPDVELSVFSDHGMTPVTHHHDVMRDIESLGLRTPEDYLAVYDSTMARFWFFSDEARRAVIARLQNSDCGRILPEHELRQLGVLFDDRRYGELIFLLHPGCLIARSDFNGPQWIPGGMHGYHPDDPHSDAAFLSNRAPRRALRGIEDIYSCMSEAMR